MSRGKFRNLFPTHILLMSLCVIFFSVIMHSGRVTFSAREQGLIKTLIYVFAIFILIHFILKFLWHLFLARKVYSLKPPQSNSRDEVTFNDFLAQTAPSGYKREISQKFGFSFCYPENWQIIRSQEKLLYMQVKETNLEQDMTILRNFNISYQNINGVPDTDFLFNAVISGVMKTMDAKLEFKEPFKTEETFGMRYKLQYNKPKRTDLCCYQIAITNNAKNGFILLTFTAGTQDFTKTKKLFDDIANLVKIFQ
ncbi:MAG: hypothetical protein V1739_03065 [Candidatus Omnitrophota bacterium]